MIVLTKVRHLFSSFHSVYAFKSLFFLFCPVLAHTSWIVDPITLRHLYVTAVLFPFMAIGGSNHVSGRLVEANNERDVLLCWAYLQLLSCSALFSINISSRAPIGIYFVSYLKRRFLSHGKPIMRLHSRTRCLSHDGVDSDSFWRWFIHFLYSPSHGQAIYTRSAWSAFMIVLNNETRFVCADVYAHFIIII